jgi:hypothetical protein
MQIGPANKSFRRLMLIPSRGPWWWLAVLFGRRPVLQSYTRELPAVWFDVYDGTARLKCETFDRLAWLIVLGWLQVLIIGPKVK